MEILVWVTDLRFASGNLHNLVNVNFPVYNVAPVLTPQLGWHNVGGGASPEFVPSVCLAWLWEGHVTIQTQSHSVRSITIKVNKDLKESSVCVFPGSTVSSSGKEQDSLAGIYDYQGNTCIYMRICLLQNMSWFKGIMCRGGKHDSGRALLSVLQYKIQIN